MSKEFNERRRHPRYDHPFILFFYLKENKSVTYEMSQVNNISISGINFSSTAKFPKASILCVELKTPFTEKPIELEGVLLECIELVAGKIYRMRVEFKDMPQQTMDILKKIETY